MKNVITAAAVIASGIVGGLAAPATAAPSDVTPIAAKCGPKAGVTWHRIRIVNPTRHLQVYGVEAAVQHTGTGLFHRTEALKVWLEPGERIRIAVRTRDTRRVEFAVERFITGRRVARHWSEPRVCA